MKKKEKSLFIQNHYVCISVHWKEKEIKRSYYLMKKII